MTSTPTKAPAQDRQPTLDELRTENEILRNALEEVKADRGKERASHKKLLKKLKREQESHQTDRHDLQMLADRYAALLTERNELKDKLDKVEEYTVAKEDYDALYDEYRRLERLYITARTLVNIPESVEGMLFEILKSRFLVWDKIAYLGGGLLDAKGTPAANADKFECYTELLPPVKRKQRARK